MNKKRSHPKEHLVDATRGYFMRGPNWTGHKVYREVVTESTGGKTGECRLHVRRHSMHCQKLSSWLVSSWILASRHPHRAASKRTNTILYHTFKNCVRVNTCK